MDKRLDSFKDAFCDIASDLVLCNCGVTYVNSDGMTDLDLDEDELTQDTNSVDVDHSIGVVEFGGKQYAWTCECWHDHAEMVVDFLDSHRTEVISYLKKEKQRRLDEVNALADVD